VRKVRDGGGAQHFDAFTGLLTLDTVRLPSSLLRQLDCHGWVAAAQQDDRPMDGMFAVR
jgi:hypothetical protein